MIANSAYLGNLEAFLRTFSPENRQSLTITANKNWISVHPVVLTMIAALGKTIHPSKIDCEIFEAKSKHYFERMGLFKSLGIKSGISMVEHDPTGRFIPITQILDSNSLSKFITEMIPLLHLEPIHAEPIRYIISEVVRNVLEHSQSPHGAFVAAQYYKKSNAVRIGIADTGLGIYNSIKHAHAVKSDLNALQLALTPGITGTTNKEGGAEFNAGVGLFFTKSIAMVNRDFFAIYSGTAMYKLLKSKKRISLHVDPFKDRHTAIADLPPWQGTLVGIDLALDENEEFSSVLDRIRDTYSESIRSRKKLKYKRPNFL